MQIILSNLYNLKSFKNIFIYSLTVANTYLLYFDPPSQMFPPNPPGPHSKNMPLPSHLGVSSSSSSSSPTVDFNSFKNNAFLLFENFIHFYTAVSSDLPVITYILPTCPMLPSYVHRSFMSCFSLSLIPSAISAAPMYVDGRRHPLGHRQPANGRVS